MAALDWVTKALLTEMNALMPGNFSQIAFDVAKRSALALPIEPSMYTAWVSAGPILY